MVEFTFINESLKPFKDEEIIRKVVLKALEKENITNVIFNIVLTTNEEIHRLNKTYRNKDSVTDVISFALEDNETPFEMEMKVLGDIFISLEQAEKQAEVYGHSLLREVAFLSVHGILHLLGYDHQTKEEEKIMNEKTEVILNEENIKRKDS